MSNKSKQAYTRINKWFNIKCGAPFKNLDQFINICKLSYKLKTNNYIVLEKALIKRGVIYYEH